MSSRNDFSKNREIVENDSLKNQSFLIYDYYDTNIYTPYEKDLTKNGYIKIPFQNSKSTVQPNLILPNNEKYKIENLYIYKKNKDSDLIKNEYNGELIIEHTPITNGKNKVYLFILLKTRPNIYEESDIDKIIKKSFSDKMILNLNNFIENMNSSCLMNEEQNIFIFKTPLLISSNFDEFSNIEKSFLPKFDINELKLIQTKIIDSDEKTPIKEGFIEGAVGKLNNDIFIDCNPVDSSDTNISMVPVNSDKLINQSTVIFMSTIQNFFIFIILLVFVSVSVPGIYKYIIMDFVEKEYAKKPNKNNYLSAIDNLILFIILFISLTLSIDGVVKNNSLQTSIGILFFICFFLIIIIMTILKFMYKDYYNFLEDSTIIQSESKMELIGIIFDIIKNISLYIYLVFTNIYNLGFFIGLLLFFLLFSHFFIYNINDRKNSTYYTLSSFFIFFISIVIIGRFRADT